jgi:type II/III secretion system protein
MKRREFSSRLLAAGTAGTLLAAPPALASDEPNGNDDRNSNAFAGHGRIELRAENQTILPVKLILILEDTTEQFGIDLRLTLPRRNENRLGILTPTLGKQFRGAREVGGIRLWGNTLIAPVEDTLMPDVLHILNRSTSYLIRTLRLARTDTTRLPALGNLPYLGRIFREAGSNQTQPDLLLFVTPTILDDAM